MEYKYRWLAGMYEHRSPIAEVEKYITALAGSRDGKQELLPQKTFWATRLPGSRCKNLNVS